MAGRARRRSGRVSGVGRAGERGDDDRRTRPRSSSPLTAADNVTVTCAAGDVNVNGIDQVTDVRRRHSLTITATGPFANTIDLSGVTAAAFATPTARPDHRGQRRRRRRHDHRQPTRRRDSTARTATTPSTAAAARTTSSAANGNDTLLGGEGNDDVDGGADNDTINGGAGADTLGGGPGVDTLSYVGDTAGVTVNLGANTASRRAGDAATRSARSRTSPVVAAATRSRGTPTPTSSPVGPARTRSTVRAATTPRTAATATTPSTRKPLRTAATF